MSSKFINELIVRLVNERAELAQFEIMFDVCVNSFYNKKDYRRFFHDPDTTDYDFLIENFTNQLVVRQWWNTYILCINDEVFRNLIHEKFDNEAAWLLLTTIHKVYNEEIEKHFLSFCDA